MCLATDRRVVQALQQKAVVVGSTGNLGLSVGLVGAALGTRTAAVPTHARAACTTMYDARACRHAL